MRVLRLGLKLHEVNDVNHPDFELGQMLAHYRNGGERLKRGHIASTGHHNIRFGILIAARPLPDADAFGAVRYGGLHREPLGRRMLAGNNDVHVMAASQAMIDH